MSSLFSTCFGGDEGGKKSRVTGTSRRTKRMNRVLGQGGKKGGGKRAKNQTDKEKDTNGRLNLTKRKTPQTLSSKKGGIPNYGKRGKKAGRPSRSAPKEKRKNDDKRGPFAYRSLKGRKRKKKAEIEGFEEHSPRAGAKEGGGGGEIPCDRDGQLRGKGKERW